MVVLICTLVENIGAGRDAPRRAQDARRRADRLAAVKHGDGLDAIIGEIFAAQRRALAAAAAEE